ncbi:hypothetical protein [Aquibium oceanicum]|nr:hypothetical protein [Aquibium oceanicum]
MSRRPRRNGIQAPKVAAMTHSIVHIGLHKTGTTSLQFFLKHHRETLRECGMAFYEGIHRDSNHVELHAYAMRLERTSTFRAKSKFVMDDAYRNAVEKHVIAFMDANRDRIKIFSAEGLSLLFHHDEVERLRSLIGGPIEIIVFLRDKKSYLASHANQFDHTGLYDRSDRHSFAYTGEDSWLIDYERRLAAFRAVLGKNNVHVLDYDQAVERDGNVIPAFMNAIGLGEVFQKEDWESIRKNVTARK